VSSYNKHKTVQRYIIGKNWHFLIKSWHFAVNVFNGMPIVYTTLWR
jgi:hypothetical protein